MALNKIQGLICQKFQPNNQPTGQPNNFLSTNFITFSSL